MPNTVAIAAMMPLCMLQNIAQPHRYAIAGEYASLRKTYTPPVRGKAEDSSAVINAPMSVIAPATIQTSSTPPSDGMTREMADGCTKIDAPMMVPTTIAVARPTPIARTNSGTR
jgi:hypothetical protein